MDTQEGPVEADVQVLLDLAEAVQGVQGPAEEGDQEKAPTPSPAASEAPASQQEEKDPQQEEEEDGTAEIFRERGAAAAAQIAHRKPEIHA